MDTRGRESGKEDAVLGESKTDCGDSAKHIKRRISAAGRPLSTRLWFGWRGQIHRHGVNDLHGRSGLGRARPQAPHAGQKGELHMEK